jgi:4-amino-4-deoxy-L-arabinose transferase-like glycosyltransferase
MERLDTAPQKPARACPSVGRVCRVWARAGWAHGIGLVLAAGYMALLMHTAPDLGMSRDESFYVIAAQSYGEWMEALVRSPRHALSPDMIRRHWEYNHEHPGLMKSLFALSWLAHKHGHWFSSDSQAFRFFGMATASGLLWLLVVFGARAHSLAVGVVAALLFATLPRVFYHAHLNAFDVPITLMITWTVYAYWRSLTHRRWAVWAGVIFGLALATKHNSWVLPPLLLIHWGWRQAEQSWVQKKMSLAAPHWLMSMAVLGPVVFVATWPWLWATGPREMFARVREYALFHVHHEYYNIAYFGQNYFQPPFPVSYPWVMTLFTVPLTVVVLSAVGIATSVRSWMPWPPWVAAKWHCAAGDAQCRVRNTDVLWLGCLLAPLVIISLPSTPIFGGTKHWFPAYPFSCLFAAQGAAVAASAMQPCATRIATWLKAPTRTHWVRAATLGALVLPGAVLTAHSHPFGLSHYTPIAGGVPGAATLGMNRQFWGYTTRSLVPYFKQQLPHGGTVWICDTTWDAWHMLIRDGLLPSNIQPSWELDRADYAIVHHEHHFAEVDYQIWTAYGTVRPSLVLTYDGVPIISVYKNPRK